MFRGSPVLTSFCIVLHQHKMIFLQESYSNLLLVSSFGEKTKKNQAKKRTSIDLGWFCSGGKMKLEKNVFVCLIAGIVFLSTLRGDDKVCCDGLQIHKSQIDDTSTLLFLINSLNAVHEKYFQSNRIVPKIKCKNCITKELSLHEFEGGLIGWALRAIADGGNEFEKMRVILNEYIKLLSQEVTSTELLIFMINVSNLFSLLWNCMGKNYLIAGLLQQSLYLLRRWLAEP